MTLSDGTVKHYDGVVAATGLAWHPRMPDYPGKFTGEMIHSSKYKSLDLFKGKRVLVIGAGNSGTDIAADAARVADKAFLSMRRAYHFIPKHIFGMPADVFAVTGSMFPHEGPAICFCRGAETPQRGYHPARPAEAQPFAPFEPSDCQFGGNARDGPW